jgi:effector-binding domain-containing protein
MVLARTTTAALFVLMAVSGFVEGAQRTAAPAPPTAPAQKPAEFQVLKTPAIHAVVLPMKGSYAQHQQAFERVDGFLSSHNLSRALPLFARYHSDPALGEANLIWEVGSPVPAGVKAEPPFEIKDIPAGLAVVHVHRGSYDELGAKWGALTQWAIANRHQQAGPTVQVFNSLMPPEIELRLPVRK